MTTKSQNSRNNPDRFLRNEEALNSPVAGDYWDEMLCIYHIVLAVLDNGNVIIAERDLSYLDGQRFSLEKAKEITKEQHEKAVKYSDLSGYVADVVRGHKTALAIVEEWKNDHKGFYIKAVQEELAKPNSIFDPTGNYEYRGFLLISHPYMKPIEAICQFEYKDHQISISTAGTLSGGCQKEVVVYSGANRDQVVSDHHTVEEAIESINIKITKERD